MQQWHGMAVRNFRYKNWYNITTADEPREYTLYVQTLSWGAWQSILFQIININKLGNVRWCNNSGALDSLTFVNGPGNSEARGFPDLWPQWTAGDSTKLDP